MNKKTRTLTLVALLIALTEIILYVAAVVPTSRIALTAVAGFLAAAAVIESGIWAGFACFICSTVLAAILLPLKSVAVLYMLFFGCYPVLKSLIERTKKRPFEWFLKLLVFNVSLTALYIIWYAGFLKGVNLGAQTLAIIYAGGNLCFVLYDFAFTRLVQVYLVRIHRKR